MTANHDNRPGELLTRAIESLRHAPTPDDPTSDAIARTISAARNANVRSQPTRTERMYAMARRHKGALATFGVAAAVAAVCMVLLPGNDSLAFGQVLEKIRAAQQLSFRVEQRSANPARPVHSTTVRLFDADKSRTETVLPDRRVETIRNGRKILQLDMKEKIAAVVEIPQGVAISGEGKALDELRKLVEKDARSLGEKDIDGVRAKGFEATIKDRKITLWANAETGNPIRIEYPLIEIPPPEGPGLQVLTDFKFDEKFDPAQFSVELPAGFTLKKVDRVEVKPMNNMVAILRHYSENAAGEFPPRIDDHGAAIAEKLGVPKERDARTAKQQELMKEVDGIELFLRSGKPGRHYQYYPGVKLGEKDRVVFWCVDPPVTGSFVPFVPSPDAGPPPKPENQKYLAVYGDLRIEKRKKDQLPGVEGDKPKTDK